MGTSPASRPSSSATAPERAAHEVDEGTVSLFDQAGQWTHRDRHQHLHFDIEVPERTVELMVRFRWDPHDMGSEHLANAASLYLFGPAGFRGAVRRSDDDGWTVIGESSATPGCLAGSIPAGPWVLNIETGLILNDGAETGHLTWHLEASARLGEPAATASAPATSVAARRPSAGGARWYRGDLHSHTVHSDGHVTVADRVRGAVERGLEFLAITDHNTISHHREVDAWPDGIIPIRGSEVTTFHGHINVFGLATHIDWRADHRGGGAEGITEQAHRQDAIASINHPSSFGDPWCVGCHWDFARVDYSTFDAMEVWNGGWADVETHNEGNIALWTDLLDAGLRLTAIAGTDSHGPRDDDDATLGFTWIYATEPTEAAILDGIRQHRVIVMRDARTTPPAVQARCGSTEAGVGESLVCKKDEELAVHISMPELAGGNAEFTWNAARMATRAIGQGTTFTMPANAGYLRVRVYTADGRTVAITNPVYVQTR